MRVTPFLHELDVVQPVVITPKPKLATTKLATMIPLFMSILSLCLPSDQRTNNSLIIVVKTIHYFRGSVNADIAKQSAFLVLIPRRDDDIVGKIFFRGKVKSRACSRVDVSRAVPRDVLSDDNRTVDRGMAIHFQTGGRQD